MRGLRIGYFADGPWSHQTLDRLLADKSVQVAFICARYDVPDQVLQLKAAENNIEFLTHDNINSREFLALVAQYDVDLFVSMSFNQIFREELINLPPMKSINCHAGKLPFYRGRNILNWALINDEKEFGITVHYIDKGIDTGDIILQRSYSITDDDDYSSLLERAYEGCATVLYEAIKSVQHGGVTPITQDSIHPMGFYCSARQVGDERLDWNQKSREVFNFVRALCHPGPEARTFLGNQEIRINKVAYFKEAPSYKGIVGAVIGLDTDGFIVKTLDSYVKVIQWSGYSTPRIGDRLK